MSFKSFPTFSDMATRWQQFSAASLFLLIRGDEIFGKQRFFYSKHENFTITRNMPSNQIQQRKKNLSPFVVVDRRGMIPLLTIS